MRNKIVEEGMVKEFTVIPDFVKMGYELMAITTFKSEYSKELEEKAVKWSMARPNIIFAANAAGSGKNGVVISLHKSYTDYSKFIRDANLEGENNLKDSETHIVSLKGFIPKPLSLRYLAEDET